MADALYRELLQTVEWTSAKFTTSSNAFVTEGLENEPKCARCGKAHPGQPCSQPHWKFIPPDSNENEQRNINAKTWYWCAKCRRWNLSHKTHQHVKREQVSTTDKISLEKPPATVTPATTFPTTTSSVSALPAPISANLAQYDTTVLDSRRRAFFQNHFQNFK